MTSGCLKGLMLIETAPDESDLKQRLTLIRLRLISGQRAPCLATYDAGEMFGIENEAQSVETEGNDLRDNESSTCRDLVGFEVFSLGRPKAKRARCEEAMKRGLWAGRRNLLGCHGCHWAGKHQETQAPPPFSNQSMTIAISQRFNLLLRLGALISRIHSFTMMFILC